MTRVTRSHSAFSIVKTARHYLPYQWVSLTTTLCAAMWFGTAVIAAEPTFEPLFPQGQYEGWTFGDWSDVSRPQPTDGAPWRIDDDMLTGLGKKTWIFSGEEFGDFTLRCDWRVLPGGEGGVGIRFAPQGDPAATGLEIQLVDEKKYYPSGAKPEQKTGAVYDELGPARSAAKKPGEWNTLEIDCAAERIKVVINDIVVQDINLDKQTAVRRKDRDSLADRPRRGRIGFQNTKGTVQFRTITIKDLDLVETKPTEPTNE